MKRVLTALIIGILCVCLALACMACDNAQNQGQNTGDNGGANGGTGTETSKNPIVRFTFNTGDVITVELYPEEAPISVANFLTYVREGYYNNTVIHRVESYVVQGGGYVIKESAYTPKGGTHDPIKGEFASNGVANNVPHTAGAISMARTTAPDSATSQFFFCPVDMRASWDGSYAAFGHVTDEESLAAIVRLSKTETLSGTTYPAYMVQIRSVVIVEE